MRPILNHVFLMAVLFQDYSNLTSIQMHLFRYAKMLRPPSVSLKSVNQVFKEGTTTE